MQRGIQGVQIVGNKNAYVINGRPLGAKTPFRRHRKVKRIKANISEYVLDLKQTIMVLEEHAHIKRFDWFLYLSDTRFEL